MCVPLFGTQFVQKPLSPHGGFPVHAGIDPGKNEFADVLEGKRPRERRTAAPAKGGGKGWRLVTIRLDEEVAHRLKVRAAEEDTSVTALICEGINHVFEVRGLPPIAGTKT